MKGAIGKVVSCQFAFFALSLLPATATGQTVVATAVTNPQTGEPVERLSSGFVTVPPLDSEEALCADGGCQGVAYLDFKRCLLAAGRWNTNTWNACQMKWASQYATCHGNSPVAAAKPGNACLDGGCTLRNQILFYDCFETDINRSETDVVASYWACYSYFRREILATCRQPDSLKEPPATNEPTAEAKPFSYSAGEKK